MQKLIFTLLCSAVFLCVSADDLVTKSGVVLKGYSIAGPAPNGIYVFHSSGVAVVPVKEFPDSMKEQIAKIAKGIPEAKRKAEARKKRLISARTAHARKAKAEAARMKKSAALVKQEQEENKKRQNKLKGKSKSSAGGFSKK